MRILLVQRELISRCGSELFTIEVSRELSARGHEVTIYSPRVGDITKMVYGHGVQVKTRLSDIPWEPELIHGHHHLHTMAAMAHFENTPANYFCHGPKPWVENAPVHPRIQSYLVNCPWMAVRIEAEFGIEKERISVIPNFVNLTRFSEVRKPPDQPRRALLFHGAGFSDAELRELDRACRRADLSLDKIGGAFGNPQPRPEVFLMEYDLVFAIGKCALEAMSCGCAVMTILPGLAGSLVDSGNFAQWAHSNFSPRYFTSGRQISTDWLTEELKHYAPNDILEVSAKVRREHDLGGAVTALEATYDHAIASFVETPHTRKAEFSVYLERLAQEADDLWSQNSSLSKRVDALRRQKKELERAANQTLGATNLTPIARLRSRLSSWKRVFSRRSSPSSGGRSAAPSRIAAE